MHFAGRPEGSDAGFPADYGTLFKRWREGGEDDEGKEFDLNPKVFEACVEMLIPILLIIWFISRTR
jgi:hypothetical protein